MSSDLLKEAIADAKAVRETALQNAKMALEEAFTPQLKSMLSAKLKEDEIEESDPVVEDDEMDDEDGPYQNYLGGNWTNESFCIKCMQDIYLFQNAVEPETPNNFEGGSESLTFEQIYQFFNGNYLTYCLCCQEWQDTVATLTGQSIDIEDNPLEESVKTRLQKLANIQKK